MSKLIFERSVEGRRCYTLTECDLPKVNFKERRKEKAQLPQIAEIDMVRHFTGLSRKAYGVDNGFYPLGSCTMKYNPRLNEQMASLKGFTDIHPLQPQNTVKGFTAALGELSDSLCEITGMDAMTLQPAAGAHGELTGLLLIKAYHKNRKDTKRNTILVPESAHGTNPASANMCGYNVVSVPSNEEGGVDIDALKGLVDDTTAGLMLTNPSTLGLFEKNISQITEMVHKAGGLVYYDGANLNAIMGIARPGDMGFDVIHLNLHKTFGTPHGGGGPGSGPVGCKKELACFLPVPLFGKSKAFADKKKSLGKVKSFYGNILVALKGYAYIETLGGDGLKDASEMAVLNANYMRVKLCKAYDIAYDRICMHEFVLTMSKVKEETGIAAMDISKSLLDYGIHPPTMYFPLNVHEALMIEPTETESKETLDEAIEVFLEILAKAKTDPDSLHNAPSSTVIGRVDEVRAARNPILKYQSEK